MQNPICKHLCNTEWQKANIHKDKHSMVKEAEDEEEINFNIERKYCSK